MPVGIDYVTHISSRDLIKRIEDRFRMLTTIFTPERRREKFPS
jgi:hypothetical protein